MHDTDQLVATMHSTSKSDFKTNDDRVKALNAARALVNRIEQPWERLYYIVYTFSLLIMAFKTAADLNVFNHLTSSPKAATQLGQETLCDPALLRRILRVLATAQMIEEVVPDTYIENDFSMAMKDPNGLINGLELFYVEKSTTMLRMPEYLAAHNYQNPTDHDRAPWKWVFNVPEHTGTRWEWMESTNRAKTFNSFLSATRQGQPSLPQCYDFSQHLQSWDGESVFFVDVGGGKGRDISHLADYLFSSSTPYAQQIPAIILQDRPQTLAEAQQSSTLHPAVTCLPHDFFTPNPIKGSKIYFEHSVLHDWPDKESVQILRQIKSAMKPGYSKLLLMEWVLPALASEMTDSAAVMDLQMMTNFSALERTESQWKELLESVGLKYVGYQKAHGLICIVEAEL